MLSQIRYGKLAIWDTCAYLCATHHAQLAHFRLRGLEPAITCHCGTEKCVLGSTLFGEKKSQQFISNFNLPHYIFIDISEPLKTLLQIGIAHANSSLQILSPQMGSLRSTINFSGDLLLPNYESSRVKRFRAHAHSGGKGMYTTNSKKQGGRDPRRTTHPWGQRKRITWALRRKMAACHGRNVPASSWRPGGKSPAPGLPQIGELHIQLRALQIWIHLKQ